MLLNIYIPQADTNIEVNGNTLNILHLINTISLRNFNFEIKKMFCNDYEDQCRLLTCYECQRLLL